VIGFLLTRSVFGPQDGDRYTLTAGVADDVGGPADAAGGLAVPYRHQALAAIDHGLPGREVRLLG
jgi:hypothetical protein